MKMNQLMLASAALAGISFASSSAFAQMEAEADVSATAEAPAEEEEAPEAEPAAEEESEPMPEADPMEVKPGEVETAEEPEEEGGSPTLFVFADAWAGFQTSKSGTPSSAGVYANHGPTGTAESGFGLNWLGADLGYDGGMWAVNGSLRFGDAVATYGTGTLGPITNAYVTYRPVEGLSLDMGAFGTIYGAEVAESWMNLNYTRGELYFNMQPFWHTGLRAQYETGNWVVRGLVVNDANRSNLGEGAMNVGLQGGYSNDNFGIVLGALQSLKPDTTINRGGFIDTFFDLVVTANVGDFSLVANGDINLGYEGAMFWGASLAAGYQIVPALGVALRGEILGTPDGFLYGTDNETLATLTATVDVKPVPNVENFVVRLDLRGELASEDAYLKLSGDPTDPTDKWGSATLGFVGYADLL